MKRLLLLPVVMLLVFSSQAQYKEISGTMGLMLNSSGESQYGTVDIASGWVLGATFGYDIGYQWQAELFWNIARANTRAVAAGSQTLESFEMKYQNVHLGFNRYFGEYDDFVPYVGLSTGATIYNSNEASNSKVLWSVAPTIGFKIFPVPNHPRWGFKTHFRYYIPMTFDGRGLFTEESGDTGFLVPVAHAEIAGGFVYRIE